MNKKQLQEFVKETKEKVWRYGITGLKFDSPQKLENIQIKSVNYLGVSLGPLLEYYRHSSNEEILEAVNQLENYHKLQSLAGELKYSIEYKHPRKRKRKTKGKILVEGSAHLADGDLDPLIKELENRGYQEQLKEIQLQKMFNGADEGLKWELLQMVEGIRAESIPHLGFLLEKATEEIDVLVVQTENKIKAARNSTKK